jgi:hypothetical protein
VVHREEGDVLGGRQPQERRAQERPRREVEGPERLLACQSLRLGLAPGLRECAEVNDLDAEGRGRLDDLRRVAV